MPTMEVPMNGRSCDERDKLQEEYARSTVRHVTLIEATKVASLSGLDEFANALRDEERAEQACRQASHAFLTQCFHLDPDSQSFF